MVCDDACVDVDLDRWKNVTQRLVARRRRHRRAVLLLYIEKRISRAEARPAVSCVRAPACVLGGKCPKVVAPLEELRRSRGSRSLSPSSAACCPTAPCTPPPLLPLLLMMLLGRRRFSFRAISTSSRRHYGGESGRSRETAQHLRLSKSCRAHPSRSSREAGQCVASGSPGLWTSFGRTWM